MIRRRYNVFYLSGIENDDDDLSPTKTVREPKVVILEGNGKYNF